MHDLSLLTRRDCLLFAAGAAVLPHSWATTPAQSTSLLAGWQTPSAHHIGLIGLEANSWRVRRSLSVPTRAHGLLPEPGGSVLAVARRPGDWLLRWDPVQGTSQWHWIGDDRRFNGHAIRSLDGQFLWTTETNLDTALGVLGVRDPKSLERRDEWSTHGMDPHELLVLPERVGKFPAGTLVIANGGIPTLPETGRAKLNLERMDSSLVALDPTDGRLLGQWRLPDAALSIRHLAWDPATRCMGIALQAEHADASDRLAASVLAVWNGSSLSLASQQPGMGGYGGDVCAYPGGGFVVSCPRVNTLAVFGSDGRFLQGVAHQEAYALAVAGERWWASGSEGVLRVEGGSTPSVARAAASVLERVQFDNHWQFRPEA